MTKSRHIIIFMVMLAMAFRANAQQVPSSGHGACTYKPLSHKDYYSGMKSSFRPMEPLQLHVATIETNIKEMRQLVESGYSVKGRDYEGNTPLHWAVQTGNQEVVVWLLDHGAEVNALNQLGATALGYSKNGTIAALLIKRGADIMACTDETHTTPLMLAAILARPDTMRELIAAGAVVGDIHRSQGTALNDAIYSKCHECVQIMIDSGVDVNVTGELGRAPIFKALSSGDDWIVEKLLVAGARIDVVDHAIDQEKGPMCFAQTAKSLAMLMERGGSVGEKESGGGTPLWCTINAPEKERHAMARLLIEKGADVNARLEHFADTPIMTASEHGDFEMVKLLGAAGAAIDLKDKDGTTALMNASERGHLDVVRLLVGAGPAIDAKDKNGDSALTKAVRKYRTDVAEFLLDRGADRKSKNNEGETPEGIAQKMGWEDMLKVFEKH